MQELETREIERRMKAIRHAGARKRTRYRDVCSLYILNVRQTELDNNTFISIFNSYCVFLLLN